MRLLLGLALGLALVTQPAVAGPKEKDKQEKHEKQEKQDKHHAAEAEPAATATAEPAPAPAAPPEPVAKPDRKGAKRQRKAAKREPLPVATPAVDPVASATPAPEPVAAPAAPEPTPAVIPTATPAPTPAATPTPAHPRARRSRQRGDTPHEMRISSGVSPLPARSVPAAAARPVATVVPAPATKAVPARRKATRPARTGRLPVAATVTRIIEVIPAPLRAALAILAGLALMLAIALALLSRRTHRLERQRKDLSDDVGLLQSALLPVLPERVGRAFVTAAYRPAEGLAAGGDFYDAFALDDQVTCLIVGDVAGHGREAIPLTASVRFTLRAFVESGMSPRTALQATAGVIGPRLQGQMVTVVVALYDARSGRLTYAGAGHPPPLLLGIDDELLTACGSPPIGAGTPTGRRQTSIAFPPGAAACFYTDGLTDVRVAGGRLGPARLAAQLRELGRREGAADVLLRLVAESNEQGDDMAACLLRPMLGAAIAAPGRTEELELDRGDLADGRAARFLAACGVGSEEAAAAVAAASQMLPQGAAAVLEVRRDPYGAAVTVRRPEPTPLYSGG
jgi:serine phosphatase RsbU (regulator of sigma subunit)